MAYEVTTSSAALEFDISDALDNACIMVDENHCMNLWKDTSAAGRAQIFTIDTTTFAITTASATMINFADTPDYFAVSQVDTNHFITFHVGADSDGFAEIIEVNTTTWAVSTVTAAFEFDTQSNLYNACVTIDANHVLNFWQGEGAGDGFVQVFTVNTTTWAVTTAAASLEFDTQDAAEIACAKIDTNHFIAFWQSVSLDGFVQVFTVNTTTWAVSTAAASLEFDTQQSFFNSCVQIDTNHFVNFWQDVDGDGKAQVFAVNTTTWAVTTAGALFEFDTQDAAYNACYKIDSTHVLNNWAGVGLDGFSQAFAINTSTWEITTTAAPLEFNLSNSTFNAVARIDTTHCVNFSQGAAGDGFAQVMTIAVPPDTNIKTINGLAYASTKTRDGLALSSMKTLNGLA